MPLRDEEIFFKDRQQVQAWNKGDIFNRRCSMFSLLLSFDIQLTNEKSVLHYNNTKNNRRLLFMLAQKQSHPILLISPPYSTKQPALILQNSPP